MTTYGLIQKLETRIKEHKEENERLLSIMKDMADNKKELIEKYDEVLKAQDKVVEALKKQVEALEKEVSTCKENLTQKYIHQKIKLGDIPNEPLVIGMIRGMLSKAPLDFILSELGVLERRLVEHKIKQRVKTSQDFTWSHIHKFF
jgi:DNA repair exonuclease SbcCD ATPase subunit